jgi:putative lipoic acid-binding regulatory protein
VSEDAERSRAIALLEATHRFPVDYDVSVIAVNVEAVVAEVRAAAEEGLAAPLGDGAYQSLPSRGGRYASHRFRVPCRDAQEVLALYERLRRVRGVITVL